MPRLIWLSVIAILCLLVAFAIMIWWPVPAQAETCIASHYGVGDGYGGRRTASGERMNPHAMTAAHRSAAFGTRLRVAHGSQSVVVRVNDRGPFVRGRCVDLSTGAMRKLCGRAGTCRVSVTR